MCTLATIQKLNCSDSLGIVKESQVDSKVLLKLFQHVVLKSSGLCVHLVPRHGPTMFREVGQDVGSVVF